MESSSREILVHISAATTRVEDDRHRAAAEAYSQFEGIRIDAPSTAFSMERSNGSGQDAARPLAKGSPARQSDLSPSSSVDRVEDSQFGYESVHATQEDARDMNGKQPGLNPLQKLEALQNRWRSSKGSEPVRSTPIVKSTLIAEASFAASGKVMSTFGDGASFYLDDTQQAASAIESQLISSSSKRPARWPAGKHGKHRRLCSDHDHSTLRSGAPSITGSHQSHAADRTPSPRGQGSNRLEALQDLTFNTTSTEYSGPITFDTISSQLPANLGLNEVFGDIPPTMTIPRDQNEPSMTSGHAGSPPSAPAREPEPEPVDLATQDSLDFSHFPRQVWPPSAPVGHGSAIPWPSQSTPMLTALLNDPNTRSRYQPFLTTRPIDPQERGFWMIDTSPWPVRYQYEFWDNMADFIRKGRGGWGMWMARGREDEEVPAKELGRTCVWCWGEVVEHAYLLCWTMSSSKVITSRMEWCDGSGNVVVRMPVIDVSG